MTLGARSGGKGKSSTPRCSRHSAIRKSTYICITNCMPSISFKHLSNSPKDDPFRCLLATVLIYFHFSKLFFFSLLIFQTVFQFSLFLNIQNCTDWVKTLVPSYTVGEWPNWLKVLLKNSKGNLSNLLYLFCFNADLGVATVIL